MSILLTVPEQTVTPRGHAKIEIKRRMLQNNLRDTYKGQHCVVVCTGPNLPSKEALEEARSEKQATLIGVNRAYEHIEPDIWMTQDSIFAVNHKDDLWRLIDCPLKFSAYRMAECLSPSIIDMWTATKNDLYLPDLHEQGWIKWGSGPGALQLAVWLGFTTIVFVGMPLHIKAGYHFYPHTKWDNHVLGKKGAGETPYLLSVQSEYWALAKRPLKRRNIRVINTSLDAAEDTTEKVPFEEIAW